MSNTSVQHPASYRDPSGFIFESNGVLYRQINISFKEHFDHLIASGCYDELVKKELLIPHEEVQENITGAAEYYKVIKPGRVKFISYPCEWSFDMLRDASLLTLLLVREGLQFNMILKDASPYNIQWHEGKFIFIDTLSFEKYTQNPWIAYRQFCECFLGPLLIMHYSKKQLPELMLAWPDGIPLAIIKSLLPKRSRFSLHTYLHIHLHAKLSGKKNGNAEKARHLSRQKLLNLISSLEILVTKLKTPGQKTGWPEYYDEASKRNDYLDQKKKIISEWFSRMNNIHKAADLGANEGEFSKLSAENNIYTVAADLDPYCINNLYLKTKKDKNKNIQPLVIDLSNPTPSTGVNNRERSSFIDRVNADLIISLALIHHLAIGKNIPFEVIAAMFSRLGKELIIEFVPKDDEKTALMLSRKKDMYSNYDEVSFENAFKEHFAIIDKKIIPGSGRILYRMQTVNK